jgi:tetrahydromethanopterin S-methyltransferase subunit G
MMRNSTDPRIERIIQTLAKVVNNDLPHMQARLDYMDHKLTKIETNVSWCMKLLIGFALVGATILFGIVVELVTSLEQL